MNDIHVLPEHIRASLAQYSEHKQCTCLHCGYSGLMGVSRKERKHNRTKTIITVGAILGVIMMLEMSSQMKGGPGIIPWWLGPLLGASAVIYDGVQTSYLACPNCNTELLPR